MLTPPYYICLMCIPAVLQAPLTPWLYNFMDQHPSTQLRKREISLLSIKNELLKLEPIRGEEVLH